MRKVLIIGLLFIFPLLVISQAVITFEKTTHDFGTIKEEGGRVTYDFIFKNEGNEPLVISNVRASCGCTSKDWTKSPVEPGREGKITVSYNPAGRPGILNKNVTVLSNATVASEKLYIKGEVIPKPKQNPITEKYPIEINGLLLDTKNIEFNNVNKGDSKEQSIKINNNTGEPMIISFINLPKYISVPLSSTNISPQTESTINFIFDSSKNTDWGVISDDFHLIVNNKKEISDQNKLTVKANIVDDFSKMTITEKRSAPIMELQKKTISLGSLTQGTNKQGSFPIKNIGEKTLAIRKIINNNSEIIFESDNLTVRSGKTVEANFTVNTTNLKAGKYNRAITLQTNDPENAFVVVAIDWEIK